VLRLPAVRVCGRSVLYRCLWAFSIQLALVFHRSNPPPHPDLPVKPYLPDPQRPSPASNVHDSCLDPDGAAAKAMGGLQIAIDNALVPGTGASGWGGGSASTPAAGSARRPGFPPGGRVLARGRQPRRPTLPQLVPLAAAEAPRVDAFWRQPRPPRESTFWLDSPHHCCLRSESLGLPPVSEHYLKWRYFEMEHVDGWSWRGTKVGSSPTTKFLNSMRC
jgi:hypothetical protein